MLCVILNLLDLLLHVGGGWIGDNAQRDSFGAVAYGPRYVEAQAIFDY